MRRATIILSVAVMALVVGAAFAWDEYDPLLNLDNTVHSFAVNMLSGPDASANNSLKGFDRRAEHDQASWVRPRVLVVRKPELSNIWKLSRNMLVVFTAGDEKEFLRTARYSNYYLYNWQMRWNSGYLLNRGRIYEFDSCGPGAESGNKVRI